LTDGISGANSWALDAHKWLNVPYDCGIVLCRDREELAATMSLDPASYLAGLDRQEPHDFTLQMSRRARGVEVWTALRSLGRGGLADLIERSCEHASHFATALSAAGYEILNDVVLNQVLVDFGDTERTLRIIEAIQADGTCWMGGTTWHGRQAMRISVSSWATTSMDVERSIDAILRVAGEAG
jgi:glutamate/tyrosine decarboxylase-like PLP-dependent enzyme